MQQKFGKRLTTGRLSNIAEEINWRIEGRNNFWSDRGAVLGR